MFSPYYAMARRRGPADPENHVSLNVSLYGAGGKRWAMTERGRDALKRDETSLTIGPSSLFWDGDCLTIAIDEVTAPWPSRIRGTVRVHPAALTATTFTLDADGRHRWRPIAPCARIEVELQRPGLSWSGSGYLDTNAGEEPLERAFSSWHWSRAGHKDGAAVLYDVTRRDGRNLALAMLCDGKGHVEPVAAPPGARLPRTGWLMPRETHADAGAPSRVVATLEDGPFYARSMLAARVFGEDVLAMHESLSLDRFRSPAVQAMLPFRMPRAPARRSRRATAQAGGLSLPSSSSFLVERR